MIGLIYILAVATIWVAASFVVQSVVGGGVSPFLITYICNSLFVVYLPLVEIGRYFEDKYGNILFWRKKEHSSLPLQILGESEKAILLGENSVVEKSRRLDPYAVLEDGTSSQLGRGTNLGPEKALDELENNFPESTFPDQEAIEEADKGLDAKGRWTRTRVAKASLIICPFWFCAQLTFNFSLKYTTVTSNTILSSSSSLFTFLVSLVFLDEKFTWVKLFSVLLCMAGSITVSLGDSESAQSATASNPLLGDILALVSAGLYASYITLIRKKLPDDDGKSGHASMAQFLGFLGLFNLLIFLPVAVMLNFSKLEPFNKLTWDQFGLVVGKGLLDNVLSDYLWAKAVLLTTTTVATAGLTIQVPLAAIVDSLKGNAPHLIDYIGALAVMVGFAGINIPSETCGGSKETKLEFEDEGLNLSDQSRTTSLPG